MERKSLVDSLMISGEINVGGSKINWRAVVIFVTFSLNPFLMSFGKAVNLSGLIPFLVMMVLLTVMFYYLSLVIINACSISRSTNYSELFYNYFNHLDKFINFCVHIYGIFYISLVQITLLLTVIASYREIAGYDTPVNENILILLLIPLNLCMILLSYSQQLQDYYKACLFSLLFLFLTLLGGIFMILSHTSSIPLLQSCPHYYFNPDFYLSTYILLVVVNIFQSLTLIYKDIRDKSATFQKQSYEKSLKLACLITIFSYTLFGIVLSFTERITSVRAAPNEGFSFMMLLMAVYRLFKLAWLVLQVCLMMMTVKSSFVGMFCNVGFEISKWMSVGLSSLFVLGSNLSVYYVYEHQSVPRVYQREGEIGCYSNEEYFDSYGVGALPYEDLDLKFYENHNFFMVNAYFSVLVGMVLPWILMVRTGEYGIFKIVGVGVVIVGVFATVVFTNFYEKTGFYFPS